MSDFRKALDHDDWASFARPIIRYGNGLCRRLCLGTNGEELFYSAVFAVLDGRRKWDPERVDLGGFLRGIVRSLASSAVKSQIRHPESRRSAFEGAIVESVRDPIMVPPPTAEEIAYDVERSEELVAAARECCLGDRDLRLFLAAVLDGCTKRVDIAVELRWTPDRVTAARIKLQRRLARRFPHLFAQKRREARRRAPIEERLASKTSYDR